MNTNQVGVKAWLSMFIVTVSLSAEAQTPTEPTPASAQNVSPPPLATGQKQVAERFSRLEALLLRSADLEAGENPARAALLQQAVQLSKQAELTEQLVAAAARLEQGQFSEAIERQKASRENLKRLLELLQSENREKRIREERDEVRRWIEETDRLLRLQSSLRGRTEGGQDTEQAAADQEKLAAKANDISDELKGEESTKDSQENSAENRSAEPNVTEPNVTEPSVTEPSATEPSEKTEPADSPSQPKNDTRGKQSEDLPGDSDPKSGDESKNKSDGKEAGDKDAQQASDKPENKSPTDNQPSENKEDQNSPAGDASKQAPNSEAKEANDSGRQPPNSQQPNSQQPNSQQPSPGQSGKPSEATQPPPPQSATERAKQKLEQAQKKMEEAQQELEKAEREGAVEKQREAEERLREAIEELEEILRQLREEEVERSLASLETRLRRMLEMQNKVLEETTRLQEITGEAASRQVQISASKLAVDERKLLAEGERAFLLLREEGSSAAFPEAIEQLNADISSVADRLSNGDVGTLTVNIEQEIVSSLEEMVEALVQVQKDNKKKKQDQQAPGQGPAGGEPGDQPLVDKLAELRLIRTLQLRINNRTNTLSKLLADPNDPIGQAAESDVQQQLKGLAERQASIQGVTRDIVVGKGE
jgi:hypothetical protein